MRVDMTAAWRELEAHVPVKLGVIRNESHFKAMTEFVYELLDEIGDRESHPLAGLLEVVTLFVRDYEDRHVEIPEGEPGYRAAFPDGSA